MSNKLMIGASPRPWVVNGHSIEANDKSLWIQNEKTGRGVVANLPSAPKWRFKKEQRAKMDALTAANANLIVDAVNGRVGVSKTETTTGNAAKMREALEDIIGDCRGCTADCCETVCRPSLRGRSIVNARAALAAPARNCDVFKSESEMQAAFIDWYNELFDLKGDKYAIDTCDLKHNINDILHFYIEWLFATTKKGATDADK